MKLIDDLRNLDRNNVGGWPQSVKIFFCVLVFAVIVLGGWYFKISNQQETLASAQKTETRLRHDFSEKQAKVANLDPLKKQLAQMKDMLQQLLRQLPSKTEMPELLVDISQTALAAGLQVDLFQPGPEQIKEFYAEKPISIRMVGTYHQFGTFISGVAALPRVVILTMHDVSLRPEKSSRDMPVGDRLIMKGTVKTYRYLDDEEAAAAEKKANSKGGGR
ncbi:MAG TPA: type 4a pilus biogenesis protein PilO [Rhodanobacteraceae bacterium]|nr:type 4a pilus biogenesis protein PilO [Rhodanobacteraceae bacterium]